MTRHGGLVTTTTEEPRVVGRRRNPVKRVDFTLAVYDSQDREHLHTLTARAQVDTGSVFGFGAEDASPGRRVRALEQFLKRVLVDDDGYSVQLVPKQVVAASSTETDDDTDSSSTELVPFEDVEDALTSDSSWRLAAWDTDTLEWRYSDEDFPSRNLAEQAANAKPSSLRRFASIMDSDWLTVEQSALEEIVDVVVSAAADRPTEPSSGSPRSQRRRQR